MNNTLKKIVMIAGIIGMVGMVGTPALAAALTESQINSILSLLESFGADTATIANVESALKGEPVTPTTPTVEGCTITSFDRNLKLGMSGDDVNCLQIVLNSDSETQLAASGVGSAGNETSYFGPLTKTAVISFQELYSEDCLDSWGLTEGTGYVGSTTRAKLNELLGGVVVPEECTVDADCLAGYTCTAGTCVKIPVAAGLTVALSAVTPAGTVLVSGSAYNVFSKINLTAGSEGDVDITGLVVTRTGYSNDNDVDGIMVKDSSGARHGNVVTFSETKATITFAADPITIAAGTTDYITLAVNLNLTNAVAGTIAMKIASADDITSDASEVNGTFPITGNLMSLTDGSTIIGSVSVDAITISTAQRTIDLGVTNQPIGKFKFTETSSREDVKINKITLLNNGTMADGDITNIDLVSPTGTVLATLDQTTSKNATFDLTASPWTVDKGTSDIFTVSADTVVGSGRTAQFIVQNDYDIEVVGTDTGAGILVGVTGNTTDASLPIGDAADFNTIVLAAGTLTASKDSTSPSGEVSAGATDVVLGVWKLQAAGEDISLRKIDLELGGATGASATCATAALCDLTGTIKVKDVATGTTIYSVSASDSSLAAADAADIWDGTANVVSLASYLTIPANSSKLIQVVVDISSTNALQGDTFVARLGNFYYKRLSTNTFGTANDTPTSGLWIDANALPVSTASLTVAKNTAFAGGTLIAGAPGLKVGSYVLQAGAADGVNVNTINVTLSANTGISNLTLKKGTTQLGNIIASPVKTTSTNSFSVSGQLDIPAGTSVTVDVYLDTATTASGTTLTTSLPASGIGATTASSGASLTNIPSAAITGQTVVLGVSGTLTVALNSTTTASKAILHAGETGVALADIKFAAGTYENVKITKVKIEGINAPGTLTNLALYDGATQLGTNADIVNGVATFSGLSKIVSRGSSATLTLKADTTTTGVIVSQASLQTMAIYVEAVGVDSGVILMPQVAQTEAGTTSGVAKTYVKGDAVAFQDASVTTDTALAVTTVAGTGTTAVFAQIGKTAVSANQTTDRITKMPAVSMEVVGANGLSGTTDETYYTYNIGDVILYNDNGTTYLTYVSTAGSGTDAVFSYASGAGTVTDITEVDDDIITRLSTGGVEDGITTALTSSGVNNSYVKGQVVLFSDKSVGTCELAMVTTEGTGTDATFASEGVAVGVPAAAGDVIVTFPFVWMETAVANKFGQTYAIGDVVMYYDKTDTKVYLGIVSVAGVPTTASDLKVKIKGATEITETTDDMITKLYSAGAVGNEMIIEDVEPTISLNTGSPSGTKSPSSNQEIAKFDVKADGQVDLTFTSIRLTKTGSNNPESNVTKLELYKGTTLLAQTVAASRTASSAGTDSSVAAKAGTGTVYLDADPTTDFPVNTVVKIGTAADAYVVSTPVAATGSFILDGVVEVSNANLIGTTITKQALTAGSETPATAGADVNIVADTESGAITMTSHGLSVGDVIKWTTEGSGTCVLGGGTYIVATSADANTITIIGPTACKVNASKCTPQTLADDTPTITGSASNVGVSSVKDLVAGDTVKVTDAGALTARTATIDFVGTATINVDSPDATFASDSGDLIGTKYVYFDATYPNQTLTPQEITAGYTMTLTVKADTSNVKTGITTGTATFGVAIDGTAASTGDFTWGYTPLGKTAISGLTISDNYPVTANTLTY